MVKSKRSKVRVGGRRRKTRKGGNARACPRGMQEIYWPIDEHSLKKNDEVRIMGAGELGIFIVKEIRPLTGFDLDNVGVHLVKKGDSNISIFLPSGDLIHQRKRICKLSPPSFKGGRKRKKRKKESTYSRRTRRIRRRRRRRRRLRR